MSSIGYPTRAIWLLVSLVFVAFYVYFLRPAEYAIGHFESQSREIAQKSRSQELALHHLGSLSFTEASLRRELGAVRIPKTPAESAAELLFELAKVAKQYNVEIDSFAQQTLSQTDSNELGIHRKATDGSLHYDSLILAVRGDYRNVIAFIRASSLTRAPARVVSANLERAKSGQPIQATLTLEALRPLERHEGA